MKISRILKEANKDRKKGKYFLTSFLGKITVCARFQLSLHRDPKKILDLVLPRAVNRQTSIT